MRTCQAGVSGTGLPPDPYHDRILVTGAVNVSMPTREWLELLAARSFAHRRSELTIRTELVVRGRLPQPVLATAFRNLESAASWSLAPWGTST